MEAPWKGRKELGRVLRLLMERKPVIGISTMYFFGKDLGRKKNEPVV